MSEFDAALDYIVDAATGSDPEYRPEVREKAALIREIMNAAERRADENFEGYERVKEKYSRLIRAGGAFSFALPQHGVNCPKAPHVGEGHLHAEDDDSPYDVDGFDYCGRCHGAIEQ